MCFTLYSVLVEKSLDDCLKSFFIQVQYTFAEKQIKN